MVYECACDGCAQSHASRKLMWIDCSKRSSPDELAVAGRLFIARGLDAGAKAKGDIVFHRKPRQQGVLLESKILVQAGALDGMSINPDPSGVGRRHSCNCSEEHALFALASTYEVQKLPRLEGKIDTNGR